MKKGKALPILFLVMFLVMVGFGIIIPVMPFLAEEIGASPTELGLLMAVYSLMQLLFAPFWGRMSDRIGRKPVIMIGISGLAVSFFLMAISNQLWLLFLARVIGGSLSAANIPTAMAYVADITTPENRAKGMGIIGAATGLGFIFGPAIGGIFSKVSLHTPFYIAGVSCTLTLLLVLFLLKESLDKNSIVDQPTTNVSLLQSIRDTASILLFLQLFISLSLSGMEATFAYFGALKAGLNTTSLGYVFMIMGVASTIVQAGLIGVLTKKLGEGRVIQLGIIISLIGFGLMLFINNFATAALFLTIFGVGNGVIRPSISSLLTKRAGRGHGSSIGLLSSFDSMGRVIGPPLGGALYSIMVGLPYISGMLLSLIALILYRVYSSKSGQVLAA